MLTNMNTNNLYELKSSVGIITLFLVIGRHQYSVAQATVDSVLAVPAYTAVISMQTKHSLVLWVQSIVEFYAYTKHS